MLTWKSNRQPLVVHFDSPGQHGASSTADNTERPTPLRRRARGGAAARAAAQARARSVCMRRCRTHAPKPMLTWKSNCPLPRAPFEFPSQRGNCPIAGAAAFLARARRRARGGAGTREKFCARCCRRHAPETMLTWKSKWQPLRVHFDFPGQHGDSSIADNAKLRTRTRRRARGGAGAREECLSALL